VKVRGERKGWKRRGSVSPVSMGKRKQHSFLTILAGIDEQMKEEEVTMMVIRGDDRDTMQAHGASLTVLLQALIVE